MDKLSEEILDEVDLSLVVSSEFQSFKIVIRGEEWEVSPENVNDGTGVDGAGGGVSKRKIREDGGKDGELDYQVRVTVIWIEKFKSMGP